eukprot:5955217-Lingulodinium_polyedra.AAC.1
MPSEANRPNRYAGQRVAVRAPRPQSPPTIYGAETLRENRRLKWLKSMVLRTWKSQGTAQNRRT